MTRTLAILALDGFADSGVAVVLDIVRAAAAIAGRDRKPAPLRATIVSPSAPQVRAASGATIATARSLRSLGDADVVLVPGIWVQGPENVSDVLARSDVARATAAIVRAYAGGAIVAGSCSGVFLLAAAGLLRGRRATTTWWLASVLRARFPDVDIVPEEALVADRRVITAGAMFAVADVALHVLARFGGPTLARETGRVLLLDRHVSQARYMVKHHLRTQDAIVRRAETWARTHLATGFDIAALARAAGTSPRTLARRLDAALNLSPIAFVQSLRLEHAINLLETSSLSMAEIATRVGYDDANTLRRLVRRETRTTPRELRARSAE